MLVCVVGCGVCVSECVIGIRSVCWCVLLGVECALVSELLVLGVRVGVFCWVWECVFVSELLGVGVCVVVFLFVLECVLVSVLLGVRVCVSVCAVACVLVCAVWCGNVSG